MRQKSTEMTRLLRTPISPVASRTWVHGDFICFGIRDIEVLVHIGRHPWEMHVERPTRLLVSVELFARLTGRKLVRPDGEPTVDYDRIRAEVKSWQNKPHVALLESLAERLIDVCFGDELVTACEISLVKPDIFPEASAAGIRVYRERSGGE